ncbi:MAG TPA: L-threonylcarbamoyladenylate synthase [Acidimicrobiales bacterium]|nr:L-threonylcarbamoyladenylate synthase [Acidimicrobiales bacterium]
MSADRRAALDAAIAALVSGRVVGVPTDTVYGLAADPEHPEATRALFALKGRPERVELPVLVADVAQAQAVAELGPGVRRLAQRFWPGALTIVVPRRGSEHWSIGGDGRSVGLRCPAHEIPRALCAAVGPLATTSANRHGEPPLTTAASVRAVFGDLLGVVLDGGTCAGSPSTVVDLTGETARCLRQGALAWEDVVTALSGDASRP